jgi:hypothetical protein
MKFFCEHLSVTITHQNCQIFILTYYHAQKKTLTSVLINLIFLNEILIQCIVLDQIMSYGIEVLYVSKYQLRLCYLLCVS